jgi:hypothetical protein
MNPFRRRARSKSPFVQRSDRSKSLVPRSKSLVPRSVDALLGLPFLGGNRQKVRLWCDISLVNYGCHT